MARTRDDDGFQCRNVTRHRLDGRHDAIQFSDDRENGTAVAVRQR